MRRTGLVGRPAVKQNQIILDLRRRIVSGELAPGTRLPTRRQMVVQYRASLPTVQQALDELLKNGFVEIRGPLGTFVAGSPPHLSRYAMVFPHYPNGERHWPRFWTALLNESMAPQREPVRRISAYFGVDGHSDVEDYLKLVQEVEEQRLAGLIFAWSATSLQDSPIIEQNAIPKVMISRPANVPGMSVVQLGGGFAENAIAYLHARGRRKVAVVAVPGQTRTDFASAIAQHGMEMRDHWWQVIPFDAPAECSQQVGLLLMNDSQRDRPDALVVADDNLVESLVSGVLSAGVRVPEELEIIGHCNFPWPTPSVVPVKRLGYDARQVLQACLDCLDEQARTGQRVQRVVPAVFEEQINVGAESANVM